MQNSTLNFGLLVVSFILICANLSGKSYIEHPEGFQISDIPDSLKSNANAVVRESSICFTYHSSKLTTYKNRIVVTILNGSGDAYSEFRAVYDRYSKINFTKGNIYNAEGFLIRKIKSTDLKDFSNSSESSLYEDNRILLYQPLISQYPYTVEFEYEITINGSFDFPRWMPVYGYNLSVQESEFIVIVPNSYLLRYIENNMPAKLVVTKERRKLKYRWKLLQFKAREAEVFSASTLNIVPNVLTAPSGFELGGYSGNLESWKSFGQWLCRLNEGRDKLSSTTSERVQSLVKGINNESDKVKIIYQYLQSRTRYVSVQLGIGGWQPIAASVVDEIGYGDCKALSNYAIALLKVVGIKAYYTLVGSGSYFPPLREDFPSHQFDHVIACVPLKADTIWLECTSQIVPFNSLSEFTSDRQVLLVKESGGELVHTKIYPLNQNYKFTKAKVELEHNGSAHVLASKKYGGLRLSEVIGYVHAAKVDQKKWLFKEIKLPNFQLGNFSLSDTKDKEEANINFEMELNVYAVASETRYFLPLNLLSHIELASLKTRDRKQNIVINMPIINIDSIEYKLPLGLSTEFVSEPVSILTEFGEYSFTVRKLSGNILYIRKLALYKGTYPATKYPDFFNFFKDISFEDNIKLVLIKTGY
jgi:Domain of Unknown Function with PDB structure (DUF3857)/Transglutaminase-like superfamily